MHAVRRALPLVLTGVLFLAGVLLLAGPGPVPRASADDADPPAWTAQAPPAEPAPSFDTDDVRELRALVECQKEADLKGYREGPRRNRDLAACMRRKGFPVRSLPGDNREREDEDRSWLERYRQQGP